MRTFQRPGSRNWWYRFQWAGEVYQESARTTDRREAARIGRARREEVRAAKPSERPERRGVYLSEMRTADIAEATGKALSPGYLAALETYWRHLLDHFGRESTLDAITYDTVRGYEAMRRKKKINGQSIRGQSIREEVACLKRAFAIAARRKLIAREPGKGDWPKIRGDAPNAMRRGKLVQMDDLRAVLPLLSPDLRDELTFGVLTGLRREELLRVRATWLSGRVLTVPAEASKTRTERTIRLPDHAIDALERRRDICGDDAPLFPRHDHRKRIAKACKAAGVPRFTFRDLRTTFATVAAANTDLASVRDVMGHAQVVTTNIYLRGADAGAAGEAVQAALTKGKRSRKGRRK